MLNLPQFFRRSTDRQVSHSKRSLRRRRTSAFVPGLEHLEDRQLLTATPELVADINTQQLGSTFDRFFDVGGTLFFAATDTSHGSELWKSDGTDAGTVLVKDINPGLGSSYFAPLANVNGTLFFAADDGIHGVELWKSDGTGAGTVLVKDINPGAESGPVRYGSASSINGTLFFSANDGVNGIELWKSDGTEAGTMLVKDVKPGFYAGPFGSLYNDSYPRDLTDVNGTLFFSADDGLHGPELWKSDGTEAGTVLVKDIRPGFNPNPFFGFPFPYGSSLGRLTNWNGTLFFSADDGVHGQELWKSDGTETGTVVVKDVGPGPASGIQFYGSLPILNGNMYFSANDGDNGFELWKSDGTESGTVMVKDINLRPYSGPLGYNVSYGSRPQQLINVNGTLFFTADDGLHGTELWKSDGTEAGTMLVKDIRTDSSPYGPTAPFCSTSQMSTAG